MRPTFCAVALLYLLAGVPALAAAPEHLADGRLREWRGQPGMIAGKTRLSRGELIYTDYLYDDYGPDLDGLPGYPQFRDQLAPKAGDYAYPEAADRYGYNAADLRELRVAADRRTLHLLIALQTMKARDAAIATVAIDADGDPATGAERWPDGVGLERGGAEFFVTTWGRGARLTDATGKTRRLRRGTNLKANAIEVAVPRRLLGRVSPKATIRAVVGLASGGGGYAEQSSGAAAAFDAAFQEQEEWGLLSHWGEAVQARALAAGDLGALAHRLELRALVRRRSRPFRVGAGFYNRIFRSSRSYGEGIELKREHEDSGVQTAGWEDPMFLGRYQPYGLYLPRGWSPRRRAPLTLAGHSLDVNHNEYKAVPPNGNYLRQIGDERGSIVITPLARGMDTWYLTTGLWDVLEAWRDVRRHYRVDRERTALTGYSMGGYMTYRMGLLMPDRFSRASVYVGPPAYYMWPYPAPLLTTDEWRVAANTNAIVENALNLPFEIVHGNADELVPITGVVHQADTFAAAGNAYRFYHHQADDHLAFIAVVDEWGRTRDWLGTEPRERFPIQVRYRRFPAMDLKEYGLAFDGAYWVDRMEVRGDDPTASGAVDATTFARGGTRRVATAEAPTVATSGGASPALVSGQRLDEGEPIERRNGFEAALTNLSAVTFRTKAMGLDPARTVRATLTGDGTTRVTLTGRWPASLTAMLDGRAIPIARARRRISVELDLSGGTPQALELNPGGSR